MILLESYIDKNLAQLSPNKSNNNKKQTKKPNKQICPQPSEFLHAHVWHAQSHTEYKRTKILHQHYLKHRPLHRHRCTHLESSRPCPCAVPDGPWPFSETWSVLAGVTWRPSTTGLNPPSCSPHEEAELVAMKLGAPEDSMVPEISMGSGRPSCWLTPDVDILELPSSPLETSVFPETWIGEEWEDAEEEEFSLVSTSLSSLLFMASFDPEPAVPMSIMLDDIMSPAGEVLPLWPPCPLPLRSTWLRSGVLVEWSRASPMRAPTFVLPRRFCRSGDLNLGPPPGEEPASSLPSTNFCSKGDLNLGLSALVSDPPRGVEGDWERGDMVSGSLAGSETSPCPSAGSASCTVGGTGDGALAGDIVPLAGDWLSLTSLSTVSAVFLLSSVSAGTAGWSAADRTVLFSPSVGEVSLEARLFVGELVTDLGLSCCERKWLLVGLLFCFSAEENEKLMNCFCLHFFPSATFMAKLHKAPNYKK